MTEKYRPRSDNKMVIQSPCKPWTLRVKGGEVELKLTQILTSLRNVFHYNFKRFSRFIIFKGIASLTEIVGQSMNKNFTNIAESVAYFLCIVLYNFMLNHSNIEGLESKR